MTLAGLGAFAMAKVGGTGGSLLGILAAIGLAAGVGAVIALPALRLRGLYLALATLAFAYAMDTAFFANTSFFGTDDSLFVARPHFFGLSFASNGSYLILLAVVFAAVGVGILALRRGRFGRRLLAMNDSPAASTTLGVNITGTKLLLFTLSAGLAGLGGALYGGAIGSVEGGTNGNFTFLLSLTMLLLAVVWGIRTIGGMLLAGVSLALGPLIQAHITTPRDIVYLVVGLAAVGIAQNPEGTFGGATPLQRLRDRRAHQDSIAGADGGDRGVDGGTGGGPAERQVVTGAAR